MNLDELSKAISEISQDIVVQKLSRNLVEWKNNDQNVEDLNKNIERFIGNSWIESDEDHTNIYELWSTFNEEVIKNIGGMTMNERLYYFSLFERFDSCMNKEQQLTIYNKLHANP